MEQNSKKTLVVNLLGGPCSSKSTMATSIFSSLKWRGWNCEYVPEFAKGLVWENSLETLKDQFYVSAKQYHAIYKLLGKVDIIITDSPIILGIVYATEEPQCFKDTLINKFKETENFNIFLNRKKDYEQSGRLQTYEEAIQKDKEIKDILLSNDILFYAFDATKENVEKITETIEGYYRLINK